MDMTIQEAIERITNHMEVHHIGEPPHIHIGEALQMAIAALQEKAEREDPKPLTYEELLQMHYEPVWFKILDSSDHETPCESTWTQVLVWDQKNMSFFRYGNEDDIMPKKENYGKTWITYRHKPKEAREMKCPWRPVQITTYFSASKGEHKTTGFEECYKGECPFYSPERKISENLSTFEHCKRVKQEEKK